MAVKTSAISQDGEPDEGTPGSPERLQQHLAALFPESYAPPTRPTRAITAVDVPDTKPNRG